MKSTNRNRSGFTLIELLTVIAIIAVLAAIIFPVFGAVQENARRTRCMTNMKEISSGLKQYELDNRKYPDFLFAPAIAEAAGGGCTLVNGKLVVATDAGRACTPEQASATGKLGGEFVDVDGNVVATGGLYPEYVKSYTTFLCPNNTWFYPTGDKAFETETPGSIGYPVTKPRSFYNAGTIKRTSPETLNDKYDDAAAPALRFYKFDSYDTNPVLTKNGANALPKLDLKTWAVRYRRQWVAAVSDPSTITNTVTNPRAKQQYQDQLMWRDPSDDAVVTMCSHHGEKGKVVTLFLSGTAKVQDIASLKTISSAETDPTAATYNDYDIYKATP